MIIQNIYADYSQCGIGRIDVIDEDVRELVIEAYPNADAELISAFNHFFNEIGGLDGSIWSKVIYMTVPAASISLSEALYDLKTKSQLYSGDENVWSFTSGKIKHPSSTNVKLYLSNTTLWYSLSFIASVTYDTLTTVNRIIGLGDGAASVVNTNQYLSWQANKSGNGLRNTTIQRANTFVSTGYAANAGYVYTENGENALEAVNGGWGNETTDGVFIGSSGPSNACTEVNFRVFGVADGFTAEEAEQMSVAITNLMSEIG